MSATLYAHCNECGKQFTAQNSGLNRARLATWKTRHQHIDAAPRADEPTPVTSYEL